MRNYVILGVLILAIIAGAVIYQRVGFFGGIDRSAPEVNWRVLAELDYITGKAPDQLKSLDGKPIKIPGFMVPLEDSQREVVEFLLVPSPQACIHVPPPPPNQMIYVKMKKGQEAAFGPIWVYGTLNLTTKKSMYGEASFELIGDAIEPYQ